MDEAADIWVAISDKVAKSGLGALTSEELVVFRAFRFVNELEMGGCSGALYNLSPRAGADQHRWLDLSGMAEVLASIGDSGTAQLLLEALDGLEKVPEPLPPEWEDFMQAAARGVRADLWEAIEARVPGIYDHLQEYTRAHLG